MSGFKYQGICSCGKQAHHKGYCKGEGGKNFKNRRNTNEIINGEFDPDEIEEE